MPSVEIPKYNAGLRADIQTAVSSAPVVAMHRVEWSKVISGEPVEINPSSGQGFKVMSVEEWSARWKRNDDFPDCLSCGGSSTREHFFTQTWCRGKKKWESESLCLDCHHFSWRAYSDPDFMTPEQYEKARWQGVLKEIKN